MPRRVVIVLPCCIGDVILGTALLSALRRAYPDAQIDWAVGGWSLAALAHHPHLNARIDTGTAANPVKTPGGMLRLVRQLRAGRYNLMVSLVRSPLMSVAALLSGIPQRAGLDSAGRGFGYTVRVPVNPDQPRHEAEIYLDVARALKIDTTECYANLPVLDADRATMTARLAALGGHGHYLVVHPGGGRNPGMTFDAKRYPPELLAQVAQATARQLEATLVIIGAPSDLPLVRTVATALATPPLTFTDLTFGQIAALAAGSALYIGNDTGMTHLAAAAGARTVAIFGPSDPVRYAPFGRQVLIVWRPAVVDTRGVGGGHALAWDWARDGIAPDTATAQIRQWLAD